jgi:hypothetical protein
LCCPSALSFAPLSPPAPHSAAAAIPHRQPSNPTLLWNFTHTVLSRGAFDSAALVSKCNLNSAVAVASLWLGMLVPYKGSVSDAPISDITASLNSAIAKTLSNVPHMPPSSPARP